jgi:hypothetical protein
MTCLRCTLDALSVYHSGATGIDITALCNQKLSAPFTSELRVIEQFLKCG